LVSRAMEHRFTEMYPACAGKTTVIYNGVDLERFRPARVKSFQGNIGMLCNLVPLKRVYEMILTLAELHKSGYPLHLHIGGGEQDSIDGKRYAIVLRELPGKLGLADFVHFYGYIDDAPAWLQKMDIIVSNSFWEGLSVALVEGMACGCYCLSHFWDGAQEVLPLENLYGLGSELVRKIACYCELPELEKHSAGVKMRAIAEHKFNIHRITASMRTMLEDVYRSI